MRERDPQWLAEVEAPGPNGKTFDLPASHLVAAFVGGNIMEDATDTGLFTPGCAAYAGYTPPSSYANMPAVRAYAASQNARSFAYTTGGNPAADAADMEPFAMNVSEFPAFWHAKGGANVYGYGSASWVADIIRAAGNAGIGRDRYKIVSAHYIGPHICGPASCGWPQADATQFSSTYQGRNLDGTLVRNGFFGVPDPFPVLALGSTDPAVGTLQTRLNAWGKALGAPVALVVDDSFGALTELALLAFQSVVMLMNPPDGVVGPVTWAALNAKPVTPVTPPPPPTWTYGAPVGLTVVNAGHKSVRLSCAALTGAHIPAYYLVWIYKGTTCDASTLVATYPRKVFAWPASFGSLALGQEYTAHVAASDGPQGAHMKPGVYASVTFTTN